MCDSDNITWGIWIRPGKQYVYQSLLVHLFFKIFNLRVVMFETVGKWR